MIDVKLTFFFCSKSICSKKKIENIWNLNCPFLTKKSSFGAVPTLYHLDYYKFLDTDVSFKCVIAAHRVVIMYDCIVQIFRRPSIAPQAERIWNTSFHRVCNSCFNPTCDPLVCTRPYKSITVFDPSDR